MIRVSAAANARRLPSPADHTVFRTWPWLIGILLTLSAVAAEAPRPQPKSGIEYAGADVRALQADDFSRLGARLARLGLPAVFVLEGGYAAAELGVNAVNVIEGFEQG